jgi:pimeloyl-ACP methyl ester carboxylesterase
MTTTLSLEEQIDQEQVDRANATDRTPVAFIHGLWLLPSSWSRWSALFEESGYVALAPGWPDDPQSVDDAKAHPELFARKTVGQIADHLADALGKLKRKPVVIGHSFGGFAGSDPRWSRSGCRVGSDRPGPISRRPAIAHLGLAGGPARPGQSAQPQPRCAAHVRTIPLRLRQRCR